MIQHANSSVRMTPPRWTTAEFQLNNTQASTAGVNQDCSQLRLPEITKQRKPLGIDDMLVPATPNQKRGKSMIRRSGQSGSVVKKGRMWHGRYYADVQGQEERKHMSVPLGPLDSMTKSEAKRKLRSLLEEKGINSEAHLARATRMVRTFRQEAEWWKENKLSLFKPSCQETMGSHVDKYLLPRFGRLPFDAVDERQIQEFVAELSRAEFVSPNGIRKKLSPKSVRNIIGVLKLIVGEKVWRNWNLSMPEIPMKEQRYFTDE